MTNNLPYIHGFSNEEQARLERQARLVESVIYQNIDFSRSQHILEVGSGVGAQTKILLRRFPDLYVSGVELNSRQFDYAKKSLAQEFFFEGRYQFHNQNACETDFADDSFDGAFICWVLEHVPKPQEVLKELKRVLKPMAKVYITEVLNTAFFLDPYSPNLWKFWLAFNDYQYDHGGDPYIGAKIGSLLHEAKFQNIKVETIAMHLDSRNTQLRWEYIQYWGDLLFSGSESLLSSGYVDQELFNGAQKELKELLENPKAVIYDAFIRASAVV